MTIQEALRNEESFSVSEKEIAHYILDQREAILKQSVHDIAEATFTSTSSVVRLCRKIGLDGFKDFRIKYAAELERRVDQMEDIDPDFPFVKNDTVLDIAQKMNVLMINSVNQAYDTITKETAQLQKAARMILKARHTILVGAGDSHLKGQVFRSNMAKIGRIILVSDNHKDNMNRCFIKRVVINAFLTDSNGTNRLFYRRNKSVRDTDRMHDSRGS
mgnify:CR=1 FL=1